MSAEYKVTTGIYTRKYQAKNIWEVGGACVEKQRISKAFSKGERWRVQILQGEKPPWEISQGGFSWCEMAKFRTMKKISLRNFRKVKFILRNGVPMAWCNCLPKAISSSFQLQIVHGLKCWILDFLNFEMVYSMYKMDFGKCSKSAKEDCSCCPLFSSLCLFFLFASLLYLACLNDPKSCQNTKTSHKYD